MKSWNLGKISGIRVRLHWTFLLLPIWILFSSVIAGSGLAVALAKVVFVLAIFGCVLLHELGHALAARQFGIGTRDITLLPIGGVAALERMPRNPWQELWIAVAGPLVNVVIASLLFLGLILGSVSTTSPLGIFLWPLAIANVILVVFNLVPAFPMDGGRILRSILAMFMEWVKATEIAVRVGKITAIGLGLFGLFSGNLMLVLVAMFVFFAAQSELMMTAPNVRRHQPGYDPFGQMGRQTTSPFERSPTEPSFQNESLDCSVPASLSINSVAAWLANRRADYCRVVQSGRTIGTITKEQLLSALSRGFGSSPVGSLLQ